jgi:hypothetical protein
VYTVFRKCHVRVLDSPRRRNTEKHSEENWVESSELAAAANGKKGIKRCLEEVMCDLK